MFLKEKISHLKKLAQEKSKKVLDFYYYFENVGGRGV